MNYEIAESEIVDRLKTSAALLTIADVFVLPDNLAAYKTPKEKGLVTVAFLGEKYDDNQSIGQVSQHSTVTFNVAIQARLMRGVKGVYAISELVKLALIGFSPSDCGVLSLAAHEFAGYQNDVWEHSVTFSCRSLRTQDDANYLPDNDVTEGEEIYYTPGGLTVTDEIEETNQAFSDAFNVGFN